MWQMRERLLPPQIVLSTLLAALCVGAPRAQLALALDGEGASHEHGRMSAKHELLGPVLVSWTTEA
eukprot:8190594-Pyramimonas_sp.AAC.1